MNDPRTIYFTYPGVRPRLPSYSPCNKAALAAPSECRPDGRIHLTTLLLVDDDETLLEVLFELFSQEHECNTAATAEEAFGLLGSKEYDLVVTDISMPGMSGEALLGFIKVNRPSTPVIFISGSRDSELARRLTVKGAADFLPKPFNLAEIKGRVARALEGRRS